MALLTMALLTMVGFPRVDGADANAVPRVARRGAPADAPRCRRGEDDGSMMR